MSGSYRRLRSVPLPETNVGEWVGFSTQSASGLFVYRHLQAVGLLDPPDFGGGDMTADERRNALRRSVNLHKPLAALTLFLGAVALEDFVRDFGSRLADDPFIRALFPKLLELRPRPIPRSPKEAFMQRETDPTGVFKPDLVNCLFDRALGIRPIPTSEYARLRDLVLIRHTVAHHAAVIREIDAPRFQYYSVRPWQPINPPPAFIRETLDYLFRTGRGIEEKVRDRVFSVALPTLGPHALQKPPAQLLKLIEFFDYFGFVESTTGPVGFSEPGTLEHDQMRQEEARIKGVLIERCLIELRKRHPS